MVMGSPNTPERFHERYVVRDDGCWEWVGHREKRYGRFPYRGEHWAHRASYLIHHGPIPEGLEIDHLCNFTWCVNPDHLEAVTHEENVRRAVERRPVAEHGTLARAWGKKCKCEDCNEAVNVWQRAKRAEARRAFAAGEIDPPHGTKHTYAHYGCRCVECTKASTASALAYRRKQGVQPFREAQHGTVSRYSSLAHKCRCSECRAAWAAYWKEHRARKRQLAAAASESPR